MRLDPDFVMEKVPEDIEAERSLLATCCAPGNDALAAEIAADLGAEVFAHPYHQRIWTALTDVLAERREINSLTLKDALERRDALGAVGGYSGILEVLGAEEVGRPRVLAEILRDKKKRRDLIKLGTWMADTASNSGIKLEDLVATASSDLMRLAGVGIGIDLQPYGPIVEESLAGVLDRINGASHMGVKVGSPRLDGLTRGFQPGNLVILAARPGIGKTALGLNWSIFSALRQGKRIAFFSLEMSNHEIGCRGLSIVSSVGMKDLENSGGEERLMARVFAARDDLSNAPIWVCDQANITVPQMHAMCTRAASTPGGAFDMVVIDYLQLIGSPSDSRASRQNEAVRIGEISRGLKLMAKDLGLPVIVLSQLNRDVEKRQSGRPQLSDLRDSGCLEQDSDIVCFIHRKMLPVAEGESPDPFAELTIAKHRSGPTGIIPLHFEAATNRYREHERSTGEEPIY